MMKSNPYCCLTFAALLLVSSGCTTKTKAQLRAQQAFNAGQQQAIAQLKQQPPNQIQIDGNVQNSQVAWSEGLTIAQAIVAAGYRGLREPREIFIYRSGEAITINPKALLHGEDVALEPGDRIILK